MITAGDIKGLVANVTGSPDPDDLRTLAAVLRLALRPVEEDDGRAELAAAIRAAQGADRTLLPLAAADVAAAPVEVPTRRELRLTVERLERAAGDARGTADELGALAAFVRTLRDLPPAATRDDEEDPNA